MPNEAAEFTEREFLEVATRSARKIGRSEDPQDILLRYALDYTEDPEETVSTVIGLLTGQNREYPREAIEEFLRTNAETRAAALAAKIAPPSSTPQTPSAEPAGESQGQPRPSFPPGWPAGRIISDRRSRDQFRELEACQELLQDPAFLRSVRMVPPQRVSAHLLARLLNITAAKVDGIEKGSIPVSAEICDSVIEIFGFHERAAEEFRNRAGIAKASRTPRDPTPTRAAAPEAEQTLFATTLFVQMRDNLRNLLATESSVYMGDGVSELWPTQRELLERCLAFLDTPVGGQIPAVEGEQIRRGQFFEALSATGTGKTDSFGCLATAMNEGIRAPVLFLTPRRLLNAQTKERFCRRHGIDEKDLVIWDSDRVRERTRLFQQNPPPRYLIASYQSLFNLIGEHQLDFTTPGSRYYRPLVILDEVPEAIGSETGNLIRETFIDKVLVAGFAATDAGAAAALFRGQAPIYTLDIAEAIERRVLCEKLETRIIDVPLDDDVESAAMLARMRAVRGAEEYEPIDTGMFARNRRVISAAVDFHLAYYHEGVGYVRDRPALFSIDGINAVAQGARLFNQRARELGLAHRAAYVHSEESLFLDYDEDGNVTRLIKNPDEILRVLDAGEIQAVWHDRMVGIGIDIPNLAVCYHVGHTRSLYRLLQEMGRITRKGDGNKTALAFNVCATGVDSYLYGDVLGGSAVDSRERRERDESRATRSPSRGARCEEVLYLPAPNVRVYASRADRQTDSPLRVTQQPGATRPETSVRERAAAEAQERSMAQERREVIRLAEEQLRQRATTAAREDIFNTATIVDFVRLLPNYTGLQRRELGRRLGRARYFDSIADGANKGSASRETILPFLQEHYPELDEHFDHISSFSLPVVELMGAENPADFLRILRDAHPLRLRKGFYDAIETRTSHYSELVEGKYIPLEGTISRFRPYLLEQTGSDELYQHLVAITNMAIRRSNLSNIPKSYRIEPAKQFLGAWNDSKEEIAEEKRSGVLMLKLREASGMSLRELADHFQSRGIKAETSAIVQWEKGRTFPRGDIVVEEYVALASALEEQATEGRRLAGLAEQVRECLTLEAARRREKRRKNPGTTMGALVAVPAIVATALLGGRSVPPSQGSLPTTKPLTASSPMEHRQRGRLLSAPHLETIHALPKQDRQKDIGAHVEETGLKWLGKKLLGKIRPPGKRQRLNSG
jgi:superfamily II DNA or RNA helicase/transcriptional regulator with XRE-family HTH domain